MSSGWKFAGDCVLGGEVYRAALNRQRDSQRPAKFEFKPYLMTGITNYSDIRLIDYESPSSWKTNYHSNIINNLGIDFSYLSTPQNDHPLAETMRFSVAFLFDKIEESQEN